MNFLRHLLIPAVALSLGVVLAAPASGQSSGDGFLFQAPRATLSLRGGFDRASAGSEIFAFSTEQLTLSRGDFSGPVLAADLAVHLSPRFELVLGGGYAGMRSESEFREWVGEDDLPIAQTTRFERVPVTAGVRAYLAPRGRSIGQFAWVPTRVAPYVGVGAGGMWYRFHQEGEFVDFETYDVFDDVLESSGWTPTAHGTAGLEFSLTPRLALATEARYGWAEAKLGNSFEGFDPIDLSGLSATIGFNVRF